MPPEHQRETISHHKSAGTALVAAHAARLGWINTDDIIEPDRRRGEEAENGKKIRSCWHE